MNMTYNRTISTSYSLNLKQLIAEEIDKYFRYEITHLKDRDRLTELLGHTKTSLPKAILQELLNNEEAIKAAKDHIDILIGEEYTEEEMNLEGSAVLLRSPLLVKLRELVDKQEKKDDEEHQIRTYITFLEGRGYIITESKTPQGT